LVDLRLPGLSGMDIYKRLRQSGMTAPVIVLSASNDEVDKVLLLEIGADDYVVKPFGARELLVRIRAVMRRCSPSAHRTLEFGDVVVDFQRRCVTRPGETVKMTPGRIQSARLLCAESR